MQHVSGFTELKQVRDWVQALLRGSAAREPRPAGKAKAKVQMLVEASSKSHYIVIYTDVRSQRTGLVGASQLSRVEGLYTKTVVLTVTSLQSDHGGRSSHTCHAVAIRLCDAQNGLPRFPHSHAVFCCRDFCGSIAMGVPKSVGMNGQIVWQAQQTYGLQLTGQRCLEA